MTTLRLPQTLLDRAEKLVKPLLLSARAAGKMSVTRSDVIRLSLARGLTELEAELGTRRRK
jgi:hypothetical protein